MANKISVADAQKTKSGKIDKRTKEGKAICERMAKARKSKNSPDYPHGAAEFAAMGLGIRIPCDIHYSAHLLCCCVCQKLKNMIICNGHS